MRKLFMLCFHAGLVLPVVILAFQLQMLSAYLLYIGMGHMIALSVLGSLLSPGLTALGVDSLHKAGFLHTLMALGSAIVASGVVFSDQSFDLSSLGPIMLPMGAALVPHVMGVWAGHILEARNSNAASRSEDAVRELHGQRERALREQIAALKEQNGLLEVATAGFKEQARVSGQIQNEIKIVRTALRDITDAAHTMQEDMEACAGRVRKTSDVLRDATKLHEAIIHLLESELFRKEK